MASAKINDDPTPKTLEDASEDVETYSVVFKFPKFCNTFEMNDIIPPLKELIGAQEILALGKLRHANHWQATFKTLEARNTLLKRGYLIVKKKKCIICPNERNQLTGRVHWLPTEVADNAIKTILQNFGEIVYFSRERVNPDNPDSPYSLVRFFVLNLDENSFMDDIPHIITINEHQGLVIIKGRDPMCLRCNKTGHRQCSCPKRNKVFTSQKMKPKKKKLQCKKKSKSKDSAVAASNLVEPNKPSATGNASVSVVPSVASKTKRKSESSTKSSRNTASTSTHTLAAEQGAQAAQLRASRASAVQGSMNEMVDDVKNLQDLMNMFSQKISEVLTDMGSTIHETVNKANARLPAVEGAASSSTGSAQDSNKQGKKKKKKRKASSHYDLAAAEAASNETLSSGQFSPKGSLDSGIALNGHSPSSMNTSVHVNEIQNLISKVGSMSTNRAEVNSGNVGNMNASTANQRKKKKNKKKSSSIPGLTHP